MARIPVGGTATVDQLGKVATPGASAVLYLTRLGGTPIADVIDEAGAAIPGGIITIPADGIFPLVRPEVGALTAVWVSVNGGPRQWLPAHNLGADEEHRNASDPHTQYLTAARCASQIANPATDTRAALDEAVDSRAVLSRTNVANLLAGPVPPVTGEISLRSFQTFNDGVRLSYAVGDAAPSGGAANYATPLPGGRWGYPANIPMQPGYSIHPREYVSLFECAKTYVAEKSRFKWDPTRTPGILAESNIHGADMPVTCSSFAGIVLSGIDYQDSLYAPGTTQNTRTRPWGLNFTRRPGAPHPFQGHRLAQHFHENGQLFMAAEDLSNIEPGDVLFFSKQQPEGPGSESYFLNIFHVGILLSAGGAPFVVHSKSASDPAGVMEDALDSLTTLKTQVAFFARPRLRRCSISRRAENLTVGGGALTLASAANTLQGSITDDVATITFNGTQFEQGVLYTQVVGTLPPAYRPDQTQMGTVLLVNGGTPTIARPRVTPAGELSVYSNVSIASTALYYGSLSFPTRIGHQALGFNLDPKPTTT